MGLSLQKIRTREDYQIPLDAAQWEALSSLEFDDVHNSLTRGEFPIDGNTIEYNGHFGSFFFFTAESEAEAQAVLRKLTELLEQAA